MRWHDTPELDAVLREQIPHLVDPDSAVSDHADDRDAERAGETVEIDRAVPGDELVDHLAQPHQIHTIMLHEHTFVCNGTAEKH